MIQIIQKPQKRDFDKITERIKAYKSIRYDIDVAELLGMTQSAFAERKRRNSIPYEELIRFCDEEKIPYQWLFDGGDYTPGSSDFARIDVYAMAGAGSASELGDSEPLESIVLPASFTSPSTVAIKVRGESMEPTIYDGAVVGIDREERQIINGKVYAVWIPYEGSVIKRVFVDHEKVILRSDNPLFPEFSIPFSDITDRADIIIGKATWVVQQL